MSEDRAEEFLAIAELAEAFTEMVKLLTSDQTISVDTSTIVEFAQRSMPLASTPGWCSSNAVRPAPWRRPATSRRSSTGFATNSAKARPRRARDQRLGHQRGGGE